MGLRSILRGRPPIRELDELAEFVDENAAFVTQKGIFEYARARAGHYAKVLFSEPAFLQAIERSRWRAFPLGLAMVGELAEGVLRPESPAEQRQQQDALRALVLSVFDRYPVPAALDGLTWHDARNELDRCLQMIALHPPKRSFEIVDPFARTYFDLMPIHERLRARDFPTMHNYLKLTLCNMHIELTKRIDGKKVADLLRAFPA
jgi:hypothetical protein